MLSLRETQQAFARAVMADDAGPMVGLAREDGLSAAERLRIYANNWRIGFENAMVATYPVIRQLGGTAWFAQQANAFQRQQPSRSGDLQYVGLGFPDYLQATLPGALYAYFSDVARLEWAYQEALIAADSPELDPLSLANVAEHDLPRIRFIPHASLRLLESRYPVLAIWQANQPDADRTDLDISLAQDPDRLVLVRRATNIETRQLGEGDHLLLRLLCAGLPLGDAAEEFGRRRPAEDLPASLRRLVSLKLFTSFDLSGATADRPRP